MAAVLSPTASSPTSSSSPARAPSSSPSANPNHPSLPPLNTNQPPAQRRSTTLPRPQSFAKNRLSTYSTASNTSQSQKRRQSREPSRPVSSLLNQQSSLSYTLVRDFAYPVGVPLHYGPPPEPSTVPSGQSTPAFEFQRSLSDLSSSSTAWARDTDSSTDWPGGGEQLPMTAYGDAGNTGDHGPPYSEDEDIQSPIVVSARQKKERGTFTGTNKDGSQTYYVSDGAEEIADGPGGEFVTYPPDHASGGSRSGYGGHKYASQHPHQQHHQQHHHHPGGMGNGDVGYNGETLHPSSGGYDPDDSSRYSRNYQFTIASPDEEMHGKAVALFDFARENENELPLVEGQVIWVSYRHGQGWLVAEDPKTRDTGLVPEEYVRLLRHIEGDWAALNADDGGPAGAEEQEQPDAEENNGGDSNNDEEADDREGAESPDVTEVRLRESSPSNAAAMASSTQNQQQSQQQQLPLLQKEEPFSTKPTRHRSQNSTSSGGNANSIINNNNNNNSENTPISSKHPPVLSTFSTSSKDLDPYPHPLRGTQTGQAPPQVVHYGSAAGVGPGSGSGTPTVASPGFVSAREAFAGGVAAKEKSGASSGVGAGGAVASAAAAAGGGSSSSGKRSDSQRKKKERR